jgi:hypothetical protein
VAQRLKISPVSYLFAGIMVGPFTASFPTLHYQTSLKSASSCDVWRACTFRHRSDAVKILPGRPGTDDHRHPDRGTGVVLGLEFARRRCSVWRCRCQYRVMLRPGTTARWKPKEALPLLAGDGRHRRSGHWCHPSGGGQHGEAVNKTAGDIIWLVLLTLGKVTVFGALMLVVGRRVIPWLLERVEQTGARDLFTLAVLAIALGIAYGSALLFGVSLALGAFFAGVVLNESALSHKAGADILPFQDAFAVLFLSGACCSTTHHLAGAAQGIGCGVSDRPGQVTSRICGSVLYRHSLRTALRFRRVWRRSAALYPDAAGHVAGSRV